MAAEAIRNIIGAHIDGVNAGYDLQQKKIDTILTAYDKALQDPAVKIPSYLHAAIGVARGEQKQEEEAKVEARPGNSSTEYRVTGSLPAVFHVIEALFTTYPPLGYGTRVAQLDAVMEGVFAARVTRSNSCE